MPSKNSDTDTLARSLQRSILGTMLAILALLGLAMARGLLSGDYLVGLLGAGLAIGSGAWILALLREGLRER